MSIAVAVIKRFYKALTEDIIPDDLAPLMPMIHNLSDIAKTLNDMRRRRGALDFDFPDLRCC